MLSLPRIAARREKIMQRMLLVLAAAMAALVADIRPSAAREWYPWCAQYYDMRSATECSFTTFAQCQASISGIGGNCIQNWYPPPTTEPRRDRRWQPFYR
jgi:Protein of unknown function (DUF3551)